MPVYVANVQTASSCHKLVGINSDESFIELTHTSGSSWASLKRWARTTTTSGRRQLAVHKTVHTAYFALNYLPKYIQLHPFTLRSVSVAGILFNAIMEVVALPSLNIDFCGRDVGLIIG